ncbi:hypothetical protein [Mycobacterium malmoense]|uniref:hypothetical protein n=1 Tax=Mycobacterium malmoense TaxID=1780 RepID=UPI0008F92BCD|nr:hypothetical protein [Mycobacterium malmoense]OIN79761.1 hypothetical protein BMG05_16575 [Mycobacterium malmoense]
MTEVFRATEPFAFTGHAGVPRIIRPGDLVSSDDPDFKGREHLFEPAVAAANRAAETASAAPGERRIRTKPSRLEGTEQRAPTEQPEQPQSPSGAEKP